jgi:DNA-binding MarR family transcriptional regulator
MDDKKIKQVGQNNIRGLIQDISERLDMRSNELRAETAFASTRPADAKTFMLISRHSRGLTALAQALKISRQAAHKSVMRLVDAGVVQFDYAEGSKRDMVATLTEEGLAARKVGLGISTTIEDDIRKEIGDDDLENLRRILTVLAVHQ